MAHIRCDFRSESLDMGTSMTVILPEGIKGKDCNVVYLLHGLADNCTGWVRYTSVERYARMKNLALVIPEVQRSFYTDMDYGLKYYTFIHNELPRLCSNMFGFSNKRDKTYIMGLSMGGYGALKCVFDTPHRYAGCAAFSAVTDLSSVIKEANTGREKEFRAIFGPRVNLGRKEDLLKALETLDAKSLPRFYLACGTEDGFIEQDRMLAEKLSEIGADTIFESWKGIHGWEFWDEAVRRAFEYFFNVKE